MRRFEGQGLQLPKQPEWWLKVENLAKLKKG